jgi:hypothetical protein
MLKRLRSWFREQRTWHTEHEATWAPVKQVGSDRLTAFQRECKAALVEALPNLVFETNGEKELYLVAELPNRSAKVYVYEDGANIHEAGNDFIAEEWDYKTPHELITAIVAEAKERVAI